jgi:hypothetical protein
VCTSWLSQYTLQPIMQKNEQREVHFKRIN